MPHRHGFPVDLHLSDSDVSPEMIARAVRAVASSARDAKDCAQLLDMLGISAAQARDLAASR